MWLSRTEAERLAHQGSVTIEAPAEKAPSPALASNADRRTGPCPLGHAALNNHPARDEALAFLHSETRPRDRLESGT